MSEIRRRLGDSVRSLRRARGWTQEHLGERATLSYKFVGEIERGLGNPSIESLERLSRALAVDVTDLFGVSVRTDGTLTMQRREMLVVREALENATQLLERVSRPHESRPLTRRAKGRSGKR